LIIVIILAKSASYEAPHYAVFSKPSFHLTLVHIFSSASCSQTPSVYAPPLMSRDQVSHPHRAIDKTVVLHILIFTSLHSIREDRRFWTEW
jgi:hypothetical protein